MVTPQLTNHEVEDILESVLSKIGTGLHKEADKDLNTVLNDAQISPFYRSKAMLLQAESILMQGNLNQALNISEQCLEYAVKNSIIESQAAALVYIGDIHHKIGNFQKALDSFNLAKSIYEDKEDKLAIGNVIAKIGTSYLAISLYDDALVNFEKALSIFTDSNKPHQIARVIGNIGIIYKSRGYHQKSLEYYFKALRMHEEMGATSYIATVCGNIGNTYSTMGQNEKAMEYYKKALYLHEKLDEKLGVARVLGNLGLLYCDLGSFNTALDMYTKALSIHEETGEKNAIAKIICNIGNIYTQIGSYHKALEFYYKALETLQEENDKLSIAVVLGNIANVYLYRNESEKALDYNNKSLQIHRERGDKSRIAVVLGNIGNAYLSIKSYDIALEYLNEALSLHNEVGELISVAIVTGNIGKMFIDNNYKHFCLRTAESYFRRSIELSEKLNIRDNSLSLYQSLSELLEKEKRWEELAQVYKKYHELYIEVQNEEVKKQADKFGWERTLLEMEKQKEIEAIKNEAEKKILQENINFQQTSFENQSRELKSTIEELVRKNSLLQHIQSDIKKITPYTLREGADLIKQLSDRVERNITPLESNQHIRNQLHDVHKDFIANLHESFPDLTLMELKIAALLSMKLTSSNIAVALFLSKRTVESHRLSLRKKIGLGKDDDIYAELARYRVKSFL
jgi:tetratricopeptide (TPR) repeat protein/DNA-binding CsgD family transcriptional regulator